MECLQNYYIDDENDDDDEFGPVVNGDPSLDLVIKRKPLPFPFEGSHCHHPVCTNDPTEIIRRMAVDAFREGFGIGTHFRSMATLPSDISEDSILELLSGIVRRTVISLTGGV